MWDCKSEIVTRVAFLQGWGLLAQVLSNRFKEALSIVEYKRCIIVEDQTN